jgi:hypothetical protein
LKLAVICAVLAGCATFAYAGDERASQPATPASPAVIAASTTLVAPASSSLPDAPTATLTMSPAPPAAIIKLKPRPTEHRFFDPTNALALSSLAAGLTADALSTQKGLSYPGFYEMNPLARPFVSSRSGAAAYSAASFGLLAGAMYVAHRTHHHKFERIMPFAIAGWEGLLSARNYHVIANGTR